MESIYLTSTSANHVANLAKEAYTPILSELNSICFYSTDVELLASGKKMRIQNATGKPTDYAKESKKVADYQAFIANIREQLKDKDAKVLAARRYNVPFAMVMPDREATITEEEVLNSWTVGERIHYHSLTAKVSLLGNLVHPSGSFSAARKGLVNKLQNPTTFNERGAESILYSYTPEYSLKEVDEAFMALQAEWRSAQAELNGLKHKIELAIQTDDLAKEEAYKKASDEYFAARQKHETEVSLKRAELVKEAQNIKILVPDNLRAVYESLTK